MKRPAPLRHLLLALLLLAVLLCTSCQRHSAVWPQLLEAEALLDTDLSAAASLLDSLDATPLRGEDAALYAILKTQADYKRDIPLVSDSLPRLATAYYGTPYRKNHHAAMAWYSLGCYYTEQEDDERAIDSYLHAKDLYPDTLVRYFALCEQNLGKHYLSHDMFDEALQAFRLYKNQSLCSLDSVYMSYADYFLGLTYERMHIFSEAKQSFYSVIGNPCAPDYYSTYSLFQLARILYYGDHDLTKSLGFLNMFTEEMDGRTSAATLALKGEIFQAMNQPDSAYQCFLRATQLSENVYTLCHSYQQLNILAAELQRYDSLEIFFREYAKLSQEVQDEARQEEISRIENDHTVALYKRKVATYIRTAITLFALSLLILILWLVVRKKRRLQSTIDFQKGIQQNQQREMELSSAEGEEEENIPSTVMDDAPVMRQEPNQDLLEIRRQRMEFYRTHFQGTESCRLLSELDSAKLGSPKSNEKVRSQIKEELKSVCSGFEWELSLESLNLTKDERLYCSCVMLGLTEEETLFITDTTHRALITKKSRIRKKISPEWQYLLFP